jgi:GT2 family glycosyltransferase
MSRTKGRELVRPDMMYPEPDPKKQAPEQTGPVIVVIILTWNQRETTLKCVESLISASQSEYKILLWDNGSEDGTVQAVNASFPEVLTHHHDKNLGVAGGRNAAAELAVTLLNPTHLVFLDNDMVVEPGFVSALHKPFTEIDKVGQTQAKLRFMYDRNRINDGGGARINFVLWQITPVGYGEIDQGQFDQVKPCNSCGGAMMVRTDVFRELGGFDMAFNPFGPEDLDFSLRLQKAGYQALYVPQAIAYHVVSHTFGSGYSEEYARHKSRHWLTFMRRHASPLEKAAFYLIGAPYLAARVFLREAKRGNLSAIRGLLQGLLHHKK